LAEDRISVKNLDESFAVVDWVDTGFVLET